MWEKSNNIKPEKNLIQKKSIIRNKISNLLVLDIEWLRIKNEAYIDNKFRINNAKKILWEVWQKSFENDW
jgi:hypothetical protein